jgi:hypothetical protein
MNKWYPNLNRQSILLQLQQSNISQIIELQKELKTLKNSGFSKDDIDYKSQQIEQLKAYDERIKRLLTSNESAELFLYQHSFGRAPIQSDVVRLGTDALAWVGLKEVNSMPQFQGKSSGAKWSSLHARAEQAEFFSLLVRI